MILFFSDLHINETAQFSLTTENGFSIRQLEAIQACTDVAEILQQPGYDFEAVVFGGDLFNPVGNQVSASNLATAEKCITIIQKVCIQLNIPFYILVGNHDASTNLYSFHKLVSFKHYQNVHIIEDMQEIGNLIFMPYIFDDEVANNFLQQIQNKENKIVFSHLELQGFALGGGIVTTRGASIDILKQFKMVLQGHYHTPSAIGHNIYVAGSTQKTSFKDPGGGTMLIYDSEANKVQKIPFNTPSWYTFDDDNIEEIKTLDTNNYVKLIVSSNSILKMYNIDDNFLKRFKGSEIVIDVNKISGKKINIIKEETIQESEEDILKKFIDASDVPQEDKQELIETGMNLITRARK